MSIGSKIVDVMRACRLIGKDAVNPTLGYKYTSATALFAKINSEFTERNLFTQCVLKLVDLREIGNEKHAVVSATITITDDDTGEQVTFTGTGSGQDAGDKAVMKGAA